ncbi:MAG: DUF4231 domain-containing protein [Oscillibacter sp.]|nr:DUF4231 domain-containing protein [Oscillibacter sp.]
MAKKPEDLFLESVYEKIGDPTLEARLKYLMDWYHKKAQHNRRCYNVFRTISTLLLCLITLLSALNFDWAKETVPLGITIISISITLINSRMDHFRYYENWLRYRGTAEKLKREMMLYISRSGDYQPPDPEEPRTLFVKKIEDIAADEFSAWENLRAESHHLYQNNNTSPNKPNP